MKLKNTNIYQVYTDAGSKKMHYYKNGKYHREAGPAVVIADDIEKYSNLVDKDLYKPIDDYSRTPWSKKIIDGKIIRKIVNNFMPCSKYYLDGDEYTKEEFNALILKKELDNQLQTNNAVTKKPKL